MNLQNILPKRAKLTLLLFSFLMIVFSGIAQRTTIESVVSSDFNPPAITPEYSSMDAANLLVEAFNAIGAIICSKTANTTLGQKIEDARAKYKSTFPAGVPIIFLGLIDKTTCNVIAIVPEGQTIRIKDNACSVNDITVAYPDLIYDPDKTGFFTIKVSF